MPTVTQQNHLIEEEYLDGELHSDIRHELINGVAYAMVGATTNHNRISRNVLTEATVHLKGQPCEPFGADMKVKVGKNFYYPDVMVDCSEDAGGKDLFKQNPVFIVEVLSDSTQLFDRKAKFAAYRDIPTLEEYVLIEQNTILVQIHRRREDWHSQTYLEGEEVIFESIGLTLPIEEIYNDVVFE